MTNRLPVPTDLGSLAWFPRREDIPERHESPECRFIDGWFFEGVSASRLRPREGVDKAAALRALGRALQDFGLEHGHKMSGCAWLLEQWFEIVEVR